MNDHFHSVMTDDGILLVSGRDSIKSFVMAEHENGMLSVTHGKKTEHLRIADYGRNRSFDWHSIAIYESYIGFRCYLTITLPFQGQEMDPEAYYAFTRLKVRKDISFRNFPAKLSQENRVFLIVGFRSNIFYENIYN